MKPCSKFISLAVCILLFTLMLSGCKSESAPSPSELSKKIISDNNLTELNSLSGDKLESYFGFKNSDIKRFSVMISNYSDKGDTVAVFEVTSNEKKSLVISGISKYASNLLSSMKSVEAEYKKVSSRLIMELDHLVILIICSEPEPIEQQLLAMGAKAVY